MMRGSEEWPLAEKEIVDKFRLLASKLLNEKKVDRLLETVLNLEKIEDASLLSALTSQAS